MYEIQNPIVLDDLNDYFVREKSNGTGLYFSHFLCRYEKMLDTKVKRFIKRYSLSDDCIADLKQIFADVLWEKLADYDVENKLPFLQTVKYDILRAWHKYVSTNCGAVTIHSEKLYSSVRKAARIYYSEPDISERERITNVCEQLNISENKAIDYIHCAEQFRFSVSLDSSGDEDSGNEPIENRTLEHSPSAEEEYFCYRRREIIKEVYESLDYNEQRIFVETIGVCPYCFKYISKSEQKTCEQLALVLGCSGGDVVERMKKKILKRFIEALKNDKFL